jgi:hypothetical protein
MTKRMTKMATMRVAMMLSRRDMVAGPSFGLKGVFEFLIFAMVAFSLRFLGGGSDRLGKNGSWIYPIFDDSWRRKT